MDRACKSECRVGVMDMIPPGASVLGVVAGFSLAACFSG